MSGIRVLIANLPPVVVELLYQAILQQPDLEWLGQVQGWENITTTIGRTDILILGVDDIYRLPEQGFRCLGNQPRLKILLLTPTGDQAIVYWRALHCHQLQIMSSLSLIESIRQIYSLSL